MDIKVKTVLLILEELSDRHGTTQDYSGFGELEAILEVEGNLNISQKYLYENMQLQAKRASDRGEEEMQLSRSYLNQIVQYLGCKSIESYERQKFVSVPVNPVLESSMGSWCSYTRVNSKKPMILQAPIVIYHSQEHSGTLMMKMQGYACEYLGEIRLTAFNTLNCSLESSIQRKAFHIVLRMGMVFQPIYLKGVFSGITSYGDPIAGKLVLIRQEVPYDELEPKSFLIEGAINSENPQLRALGEFFEHYEGNNIKEFSHNIISFNHGHSTYY